MLLTGLLLKPYTATAYWLAPRGLLILLSYSTQDYQPKGSTTHSDLGLPHQPLIKKILLRTGLQTSLLEPELLFPDVSKFVLG